MFKQAPAVVELNTPVALSQKTQLFRDLLAPEPGDEFRLERSTADALGFSHEIHQQYHQGIKVDGAALTVHIRGGKIELLSGELLEIGQLSLQPSVSEPQALAAAMRHAQVQRLMDGVQPAAELVIAAAQADAPEAVRPRLAYKFDLYAEAPLYRAWVYVDAHTGEVFLENPRIHHADVPASGPSRYNGTVTFTADQVSASSYRLRQTSSGNGLETYSLNNGTNYGAATDVTSTSAVFTSDPTAVQAHWGAEKTHAYYLSKHNRNSYNGAGAVLRSYVHYSTNYANAYWDGSRMTYGDGNGTTYGPMVALDIAGHEITHGVTEYSANLVYQRESGALNESFSDIFGEMVEYDATGTNDWQMGTDIGIGGSGAIRSMNNPNLYGDPDTYGGTNWSNPNCSFPSVFNDYCGVHSNSGVQNKWFYVLAMGESGTNDLGNAYNVTGIGREKAAAIAYRNLTVYLTTNSTFASARTGAIQAAADLYGANSAEVIATTNAWHAVGVGAAYQPPVTDTQKPTAPANLAASNTTATSTQLAWTASADNVAVTGYRIYVNGTQSGTSATNSFTLNGLTASTTYSIYVAAVDAVPNVSDPSNTISVTTLSGSGGTPTTILAHYFETNLNGWTDGGADCARVSTTRSYEGSYSVQLRDNSGAASAMTSPVFNASTYSQLDVQFYFQAYGMETGEDFWVRYYNGSAYQTVATFAAGTGFNNNAFYVVNLTLSNAAYTFPTNARIRIQNDASDDSDQIFVDAVTITGSNPAALLPGSGEALVSVTELSQAGIQTLPVEELLVFPNPAREVLTLQSAAPMQRIRLYTAEGKLLRTVEAGSMEHMLPLDALAPGIYLLRVETESGVLIRKFSKQ
ncbi:MAG: M4 family metallopeptidase [Bacteroidia bacterium]|nr:M4 family metallopeptidase [Bacteroidia bacterium]